MYDKTKMSVATSSHFIPDELPVAVRKIYENFHALIKAQVPNPEIYDIAEDGTFKEKIVVEGLFEVTLKIEIECHPDHIENMERINKLTNIELKKLDE